MTFLPLVFATIIVAYLNIGVTATNSCDTFCMTSAECEAQYMHYYQQFGGYSYDETEPNHDPNFDIPPAGCFMKHFNIFYSEGTDAEKMNMDLPGTRERVCCDPMETHSNQLKVSPEPNESLSSSSSYVRYPNILASLLLVGVLNLMML